MENIVVNENVIIASGEKLDFKELAEYESFLKEIDSKLKNKGSSSVLGKCSGEVMGGSIPPKKIEEDNEEKIENKILVSYPIIKKKEKMSKAGAAGAAVSVPIIMNEKKECSICCEKYNKVRHTKIICLNCNYDACRECQEKFILEKITPSCMNCKHAFTRDFITENFTKNFILTDLKKHREEIIFQKEKNLLPLRQKKVEAIIECRKITEIQKQYKAKIEELNQKIGELNEKIYELAGEKASLMNQENKKEKKVEYVRKCTTENCRGYLDVKWKCALCENTTCKECYENLGKEKIEEHICKEENKETAKCIEKETRPCPKCGARIFKINGCDNMWCTSCNDCSFNWKTGKIEEVIHNPHYFEYQRKTKGNINVTHGTPEIVCGNEITHRVMDVIKRILPNIYGEEDNLSNMASVLYRNLVYKREGVEIEDLKKYSNNQILVQTKQVLLTELVRNILHVREVERQKFYIDDTISHEENGIKYLLGELDEEKYRILLQRDEKAFDKNREMYEILTTYITVGTEIIWRCIQGLQDKYPKVLREMIGLTKRVNTLEKLIEKSKRECEYYEESDFEMLNEFEGLFEFINSSIERVNKNYQSKISVRVGSMNSRDSINVIIKKEMKTGNIIKEGIEVGLFEVPYVHGEKSVENRL